MNLGSSHRPLRDVVLDEIRGRIVAGAYAPGVRLVEDRVAQDLGVSRNPVREALRVLEAEGFVEMIPRRGAVVARLSDREVEDIFECRTALEALAARLAARHATDADMARIREVLAAAELAVGRGDGLLLVELNTRFHQLVIDAAANKYLSELLAPMRGRLQWIFSQSVGIRGQDSLDEHVRLADAIERRDESAAAALAVAHIDAARASYLGSRSAVLATAVTSNGNDDGSRAGKRRHSADTVDP